MCLDFSYVYVYILIRTVIQAQSISIKLYIYKLYIYNRKFSFFCISSQTICNQPDPEIDEGVFWSILFASNSLEGIDRGRERAPSSGCPEYLCSPSCIDIFTSNYRYSGEQHVSLKSALNLMNVHATSRKHPGMIITSCVCIQSNSNVTVTALLMTDCVVTSFSR